ncbi:MAG: HlyD family secretion protein [Spirosomataceae bacterium]
MLNITNRKLPKDFDEKHELYVLDTLKTPKATQILKKWMVGFFIVFFVVLFLPWQQNINGNGLVTALTPQDRPQTVQNTIDGQIVKWNIREGQEVKKGDTLLVISEIKDDYFDPNILLRLDEQINAKGQAIEGYRMKISALQDQLQAIRQNYEFSIQKASNKIKQNTAKVQSDSIDVVNDRLQVAVAKERVQRGELQYKQQILSLIDLETRRLKIQEVESKLLSTQNKLQISKQELLNSRIEYTALRAEYNEKLAKATSDLSSAEVALAEGDSELSKLINKKASVAVRQGFYVIRAPQDGFVVRALKAGIGETIKQGEAVCTLQPTNPQMAVELYVRAMDVPLIQLNREVRIEFEGWPALQFSGWPSVAVGTFGGEVAVIDYIDSPDGTYRLLVTPKEGQEAWPPQLRMGSGVYGWVMLEDVPVWYEIWRQLNAFPPSLKEIPKAGDAYTKKDAGKEKK